MKRPQLLCWLLALGFAVSFGAGLLVGLDRLGIGDWDYFTSWSLAIHRSIIEFSSWPSWSPWHCGGMPVAANFQSRLYTPTLALVLAFGPLAGARIWMLMALALGFEGTRRLARTLGASPWAAAFAALAVAGNGGVFLRLGAGHLGDVPYLLLPWLLLGVRRSWDEPFQGALVAGVWGALCWVEAGLYPLVYGFMIAGTWSVAAALRAGRGWWRPLRGLALAGGVTALLAAPSLLPALDWMTVNLRSPVSPERIPLSALPAMLFGRQHSLLGDSPVPELPWGWHEYGAYLGPVFLVAAALAALRRSKASVGWLAAGIFFLLVALGDHGPSSPWSLLHHLPVFESLRASGRALQPAILCLALAISLSLGRGRAVTAVTLIFALDLATIGPRVLFEPFNRPFQPAEPGSFVQAWEPGVVSTLRTDNYTSMSSRVAANRGVLACYEPCGPVLAATDRAGGAELELLGRAGAAELEHWSPNHISLLLPTGPEATVLLNMNHDPSWRELGGSTVESVEGLLAVRIAAEDQRVELLHEDPLARAGLGLSLVTLLSLILMVRRETSGAHPEPSQPGA